MNRNIVDGTVRTRRYQVIAYSYAKYYIKINKFSEGILATHFVTLTSEIIYFEERVALSVQESEIQVNTGGYKSSVLKHILQEKRQYHAVTVSLSELRSLSLRCE